MPHIAVQGCRITCSATPPSGDVSITSTPSTGVKINGKGVYREKLSVLVPAGSTQGGGTLIEPVTIDINPSVIAGTQVDGKLPLAVGDTATKTGSFQVGNSVSTLPIVVAISDAGQTTMQCT